MCQVEPTGWAGGERTGHCERGAEQEAECDCVSGVFRWGSSIRFYAQGKEVGLK